MLTTRRSLITGLVSLIAAPAIVRVSSLMPVHAITDFTDIGPFEGAILWDPMGNPKVFRDGQWQSMMLWAMPDDMLTRQYLPC